MNIQLKIGLILIFVIIVFSIISVSIFGFDIDINMDNRFEKAFGKNVLGTDSLGRDILSSIIFGLWFSLFISIVVVFISSLIGLIIGVITGYFGGFFETLFLRIGDILLAFPGFLLIILWMMVFGNGVFAMIFAITFSGWVWYARVIRGEVLKYKNKEFVLAAIGYNASFFRVVIVHLFPHFFPVLLVQISIGLSNVILIESSLNFLGLGVDPHIPTLGQLVFNAQEYIFFSPSLILFPGFVLFVLILTINFIGEGIRLKYRIND